MDPIAQTLNEIKNAQQVLKETISFSFSNFRSEILRVLEQQGFVAKVEKKGRGIKKTLEVHLKYQDKLPVISGFKKISKSSQRIFLPAKKIRGTKKGQGVVIISTSQGLMTALEAKKKKIGGEVICEVW